MSESVEVLEIKKCVLSKLWYTTLILYQETNSDKSFCCQSDIVDFIKSESLIENSISAQNNSQQWIIQILLQKLIGNVTSDIRNVKNYHSYMQMLQALQLCQNLTIHIQQKLLMIYESNAKQADSEVLKILYEECFTFFKQNIYNNPTIVCWILNELLSLYVNTSSTVFHNLQDFYVSLVNELLGSELSKQQAIDNLGCTLCILSKMNISESNRIEWFKLCFPILLKTCNIQDIELALYSRTERKPFNAWRAFFNETCAHYRIIKNLDDALKIQEVLFDYTSTIVPVVNTNNLVERVINTKLHWATDILDICYILMMNRKYDNVSSILNSKIFRNFWPVLLFKVLGNCENEEIISNGSQEHDIIKYIRSKCDFDRFHDSTLQECNIELKKCITVVEYIMNQTNNTCSIDNDNQNLEPVKQRISIKQIIKLLLHFNSLSVLKMTTNIHEQQYNAIENLLKDLSEPEDTLYAYCSMFSALKALLLCDTYDTKQSVIMRHFTDMKYYVQILYPLNLRIDVIKNIFSLLFLRHEHFDYSQKSYDNSNTSTSDGQTNFGNKLLEQSFTGFFCNKYAIRDMLFHLKEILSVTEVEFTKMKNENGCAEIDQIEKDISAINAVITDAKWRLELYTNSQFVEDINIYKDANKNVHAKHKVLIDGKLISNRFKENVFSYQKGSISDDTKIRSDSSSESEPLHNSTRWKKRKNTPQAIDAITNKDTAHKPLFVNFMLATKESLVIQCLWKNDYIKAKDIIEASDMKNTQLCGELQFSKALCMFRENICKQANSLQDKNPSNENLQSSTFENLRQVAQEGILSSRQTSQFETFLASQEINLRLLSKDVLSVNEIFAICVLDMALTMSPIYSISSNLCDVAMKYLKLCKTFDNTEYEYFFSKIYQLLHERKEDLSVENILCDAKISLSMKEFKAIEDIWTDIAMKHQKLKESQTNKHTINKILKDSNYLPGLKILSKAVGIPSDTEKYIQIIYSHLKLLHTIIPTDHQILTVSDLLKTPLHYYFGYQIFNLETEPDKLERIAHNLQVNLVYSILTNACPILLREKSVKKPIKNKENGCIILNKELSQLDLNHDTHGPNECVSEILTELLEILQGMNVDQFSLSDDVCRSISKHPDIKNVLSKTSRLARLDLSELSMGDETLTFLLNTWNLMFLHASLIIWTDHPAFNNLQQAVSLMSIGYLIGDLGLVTLTALRSKLLNNMMLSNKFFMELEELNEPIWQDLDITHDPKVIFTMASEFYGTPRIRVCNPKTINESLKEAFQEYFDYYSSRFEESEQNAEKEVTIMLPDIVQQYQNFISNNWKNNMQDINDSQDLLSVDDYFKHIEKNVIIQYIPPSNSYNVILKYKSLSYTHNEKETNSDKSMQKADNVRSSLLQYLESYCWVVSYLLQRIFNENPTILENNCDKLKRTACLENLLSSSWIKDIKSLFENNEALAAILEIIPRQKLWSHFEETLKENEWHNCLKLLNALPDNLITSTELQYFKDKILGYIISKEDTKILQYVYQIKDIYILSQTVLYNVKKWHVNISVNALLHTVHHMDTYKLPAPCKLQLKEILHRVLIFHRMLPYCTFESDSICYNVAYCTDEIDQFQVIRSLISADKFELCLEWLESQAFSLEIDLSVEQDFLIGLLRSESQHFKQTSKFLQSLPLNQSVKLCETVLKKLDSIDSMQFICNYLLEHCKATETIKYRKTTIGIEILHMLDVQERALHIHLIKEPLLMLEQLLMNCKFESVQKILNKITDRLAQVGISRDDFDKTIRFYAQKSLDCRVSLQCDTVDSKSKRTQYLETENNEFVMPVVVPTKEEWVPNDKARKCSCCKTVIFSMFNRRHHCRRCGRVICAQCSQHRMQVSGYPPSVLVRVCDDCKRLTVLQTRVLQGTPSTASSETFDCWKLTKDEKHNESIREEFSFEYAPNISLCLAILNLHSDHETYTSFLLDRCDEMKRLLQPVSGGKVNPEVDHTVIIKMIRSLLVAAKVKCAKLGFNTGLVHCDRFLSQVDLIASLVHFDCLHYIPSDNLDGKALKKLRDLLIEKEQWILALDVSTKAGLDTQGVWVTWGKTCLKVGYFDEAREKFSHCLDKIQHEEFDDWVFLSYPKDSMTEIKRDQRSISENKINEGIEITMDELSVRKTEISKNRPLKDPPLLTEIQQILDNLSTYKQYVQFPHQCKSNAAQEISIVFGYLKVTNQGQTTLKNPFSSMQQIYYYETLYYLLMYGSLNSVIEFFLKHDQFDECLTFTLENDLEPDLFFNGIYMYCLKNGNTEKLHEAMKNKDPSLLIWKKYLIYVCYSLERRQYLHILYQLQLFMKDFIRAAMTCIRFYRSEISNYSDLCAKGHYLLDAREHLESELQIESLNRKRKKSTSSMHSNHGILTMEMEPPEIDKHVNTISRQMEIAKFLATCEKEGRTPVQFLNLFPGKDSDNDKTTELPTLFGNQQQKIDLAVLAILCGRNIEEGFGIAFRIMQDYNLPQQKVYSLAGHILTLKCDIPGIEQLVKCCHSSGISNSNIISDYVLTHCIKLLLNRSHGEMEAAVKNDVHNLIKLITDIELKINAYIECKHLKTAYLLAVNHSRAQDIRKILKESDRLGQTAIKAICMKWLQQEPKS
ncbi:zinc finger FYVE-type containing 26 spastizin [Halictus rubicundus]|uniref:zinc finger FYVE-type containing 26 spastizin n=1 Tax=Halictus rubicundus TaxID=77578 RepID=UPI004036CC2F